MNELRKGGWREWGQGQKVTSLFILLLALLLVIYTGLGTLLLAITIPILAFSLGATLRLYLRDLDETAQTVKQQTLTNHIPNKTRGKNPRGKLDMRISGSAIIDEIIHEMIDYVIRDYVHSWYDFVSDDDEFIHLLRKGMQESLVNLSSRIKEVDWIPYLTTHLVDDGASHLRIYRTAVEKVKENPNRDLLTVFFDLEATMEKNLCRDMSCIDESHLNDYFQGIAETLLYLVLPQETYACTPIGSVAQDLLVTYIFIPVLNLVSDPDFVNQSMIWLCQGFPVSSDLFLSVIRTSDSLEEMSATHDFFQEQHAELKAAVEKSLSGDELSSLKQQLKCVNVIKKGVDQRLSKLKEGDGPGDWADEGEQWQNYFLTPGVKLHSLSIDHVLKNNVSISYFLDYMGSVGGTNLLLMYFNTAAWKSLAEQQFMALEKSMNDIKGKDQIDNSEAMMDCLKTAAQNVFEEFLSDNAIHKVRISDSVVRRFCIQLQTGSVSPALFDDIHEALVTTMESTEKFFPSFTRSKHYIKCLMDLDLLRTESTGSVSDDEEDDLVSLDDFDISMSLSDVGGASKSVGEEYQTCLDCLKVRKQEEGVHTEDILLWEKEYLARGYQLKAEIIEAGLTSEKGKQFGVYAIQVVRFELWDMKERRWHIYRRYSDFYDFHQWIKAKWMRLSKIEFPSKHTFRTTDRPFLERRMGALNKYLDTILSMTSEQVVN